MEREAKLVKRLIEQACEQAKGNPILDIKVIAAKCAGVDEGLLRFYWDQYAPGTVCHGAKIEFERVPFLQKCPSCGYIFPSKKQNVSCPKCSARHTATLMGDECAIVEVKSVAA